MALIQLSAFWCGWLCGQGDPLANLDFHLGTLTGWEGEGFTILAPSDPRRGQGQFVSSEVRGGASRTALLHRAIVVPPKAGVIRFAASAVRPHGAVPNENLDVVLLAAGKRIIPKQVRDGQNWRLTEALLPSGAGHPREYLWRVSDYAGQALRVALIDHDDRPGCFVICSGFQILANDEFEEREFTQFMDRLADQHKLAPMARFASAHFLAVSNAEDGFSEMRLRNCELIYSLFWDHFRRKGFRLQVPAMKLMVAVLENQAGFNAYLGRRESPFIVGIYHTHTNRFVVYDFGQNDLHLAQRSQAEQRAKRIPSQIDRQRYIETVQRVSQDVRTGANIGTIMHEVAHQLSFNCGMLNREGDVPFWLAEGLACYCESTANGTWQGIGEPNPSRLKALANVQRSKGSFISLKDLVQRDDWMPPVRESQQVLLAYAQSWVLFHMLMEEQPKALQSYLRVIYQRQVRDRRLADFQQAFGSDWVKLERRYLEYIESQIQQHARAIAN